MDKAHAGSAAARAGEALNGKACAVLLAAVVVGAVVLAYVGGRPLFARGLLLLPMSGRIGALVLVLSGYAGILAAVAFMLVRVGKGWPSSLRWAGGGCLVACAAALLTVVPLLSFVVAYAICHTARLCSISLVPERVMFTLNVATTSLGFEAFSVLLLVVVMAVQARRGPRPSVS